MKTSYTAPKLTVHGDASYITQVIGNPERGDFIFLNGSVVSNSNDIDSVDLVCTGSPANLNCTPTP
jgi:hypothetical protein